MKTPYNDKDLLITATDMSKLQPAIWWHSIATVWHLSEDISRVLKCAGQQLQHPGERWVGWQVVADNGVITLIDQGYYWRHTLRLNGSKLQAQGLL